MLRPTHADRIEGFARQYEVPVTASTVPLIGDALSWSRRWHLAGGIGGLLASWTWGTTALPGFPFTVAAGVGVGSLLAELTRRPRRSGSTRAAAIQTRTLADFVQRFAVIGFIGAWAWALAVVVSGFGAWTTPDRIATGDLIVGAAAVALGGAALPLSRAIARRPAPREDPAVAAVLHAVRTASIGSVLGGGLVILAAGTSPVAHSMALADSSMSAPVRHLNNAMWLVGLAILMAGLGVVLGSYPRRPQRTSRAAAT